MDRLWPAPARACPQCIPELVTPRPTDMLLWCWFCGAYHYNGERLCQFSETELAEFMATYVQPPRPIATTA